MKIETAQAVALYVCALIIGSLFVLLLLANADRSEAQATIKRLEADVRAATGKYLDLGETHAQEIEDAHSAKSVELYALQLKLDACTAAKK